MTDEELLVRMQGYVESINTALNYGKEEPTIYLSLNKETEEQYYYDGDSEYFYVLRNGTKKIFTSVNINYMQSMIEGFHAGLLFSLFD